MVPAPGSTPGPATGGADNAEAALFGTAEPGAGHVGRDGELGGPALGRFGQDPPGLDQAPPTHLAGAVVETPVLVGRLKAKRQLGCHEVPWSQEGVTVSPGACRATSYLAGPSADAEAELATRRLVHRLDRGDPGPRRAACGTRPPRPARRPASPSSTASTRPSARLRTQPATPHEPACRRHDSRYQTPWTTPSIRR